MSMSREEIVNKIRQGTQRRVEESQRIRQLKQEQREELQEREQDEAFLSASGYIPYILLSLVFLSFPLSEPTVDWLLVTCIFVLNGLWMLFFCSASWMNWALMILSNVTLIHWSFIFPDLPGIIMKLPPQNVAAYVGGNVTAFFLMYFAYVERRAPWAPSAEKREKKKTKSGSDGNTDKKRALEEFARRREKMNRIDLILSLILVGNVVALTVLGVIPKEVLIGIYHQLVRLLR